MSYGGVSVISRRQCHTEASVSYRGAQLRSDGGCRCQIVVPRNRGQIDKAAARTEVLGWQVESTQDDRRTTLAGWAWVTKVLHVDMQQRHDVDERFSDIC